VSGEGLSGAGLARLEDVLRGHVEQRDPPGLTWALVRHGQVHAGVAGSFDGDGAVPIERDTIFRISSMTKPVTAVAALILVEEHLIRLDEPVDVWLPELANRRVLARPDGPLDETVPAHRPITVRDLLTFRLGLGMDFAVPGPQPVLMAAAELGLGAGPPAPAGPPEPGEWIRRLGTLPLAYQPGERWLYHTGADVLGVLIARASGRPFDQFLQERIFEPLGMRDTGFSVPAAESARFGSCWLTDTGNGRRDAYDPPDGQWSRRPAFPGGGAGLVSTLDDFLAFAEMLRAGGMAQGKRILSRSAVEGMTTNQLTPEQMAVSAPDPSGARGWGFGVAVQVRRAGPGPGVGAYGWDGGLGTSWANDPTEDLIGVLLTNQMWTSPARPPVCEDFWTCAYAAIND